MNPIDFINILKQAGFKINQNQDNDKPLCSFEALAKSDDSTYGLITKNQQ